MRIQEIIGTKNVGSKKQYSSRISVYLDDVESDDMPEVAGMLRGLMCSIEGWGSVKGYTNDHFSSHSPVVLEFSSPENADYFKNCVEYYFSKEILQDLKVKRRFRRVQPSTV